MARVNLTPGRIAGFRCPEESAQAFLWDTDTKELAVRATIGAKAYIFQSRFAGKSLRLTIGNVNTWNIKDARTKARALQKLIDDGKDPRIVKAEMLAATAAKQETARERKAPALEAWNEYVKARSPKWSERYKADHAAMVRDGGETITRGRRPGMADKKQPGILRPLMQLPLHALTRDRIAAWVTDEVPARPVAVRRALALLRAFLTWAGDRPEYRLHVHADACNRLAKELPAPASRDDCLQREQLEPWFTAVRALPNPAISAYLQCLLLTGARRNELSSLQWGDVDFQWKALTIKDKVEGERTIPLTPFVAALLLDLKHRNENPTVQKMAKDGTPWKPSPWVFASPTSASGRIQEPRIAHNRAIAAAGLPPLSLHGLRRSFGTLAEWVESPAGVVAQIMGHKPSAIAEKHYRRRPLDLLRMWHVKIENWMLKQARLEQPKEEMLKLRAVAQ